MATDLALRTLCTQAAAVLLVGLTAAVASAHDIPHDVTVRAFLKPEPHQLRLVVRVPLRSITDIEYARRERDFVDLTRVKPALDAAAQYVAGQIDIYENGKVLPRPTIVATRLSLESDRSFSSYDEAIAHTAGPPLAPSETLFWEQGLLDVVFAYPIEAADSSFSVDARFDRLALREITALEFLAPNGVTRAYELDSAAGRVTLDPRWFQAARRFVAAGFAHILTGTDHLLFLLALVIPFRRVRRLVPVVTAFTAGHSVTFIAAALQYGPGSQWFPALVETLIAVSILYMALENIVRPVPHLNRRWLMAFGFGLVHGFGFSFGLQHTLQFAGSHLLLSLVSFNVGVELGQLLVLGLVVPLVAITFRVVVEERLGIVVVSAFVAHTAWHWTIDRFTVLRQYPWPSLTTSDAIAAIRWLMVAVAVAGVYALWSERRHQSAIAAAAQPVGSLSD